MSGWSGSAASLLKDVERHHRYSPSVSRTVSASLRPPARPSLCGERAGVERTTIGHCRILSVFSAAEAHHEWSLPGGSSPLEAEVP